MAKGLMIEIFKHPMFAKCANGGLSERFDKAIVIGEGIPEIFSSEQHELPVLKLTAGYSRGTARLEPVNMGGKHTMFGGSYGATCDSRFTEAVERITGANFYGALPIHDRTEG